MVCIRSDIGFAVDCLSQYMERPTKPPWKFIKQTFTYIAGIKSTGIAFSNLAALEVCLVGCDDSNAPKCKVDRETENGYLYIYAGGLLPGDRKSSQSLQLLQGSLITLCWVHRHKNRCLAQENVCISKDVWIMRHCKLEWTIKDP